MVVSALIKDESIPVKLSIQPIIREPDGLAMSSRNSRLSAEGRKKATSIYSTLTYLKKQISMGDNEKLTEKAFTMLENAGLKTEYIDIRETDSFKEASLSNTGKKVILIAAWCDGVRLIDNLLID
jgi:pantoate--beta-alanine ligase